MSQPINIQAQPNEFQSSVEDFLNFAFDLLRQKNKKTRTIKSWIKTVSLVIERFLPNYNFIIYRSIYEPNSCELNDEILRRSFNIEDTPYTVVIFRHGYVKFDTKPKKSTYLAYGKSKDVYENVAQPLKRHGLLNFFVSHPVSYTLIFKEKRNLKEKEIDKQQEMKKVVTEFKRTMPIVTDLFYALNRNNARIEAHFYDMKL